MKLFEGIDRGNFFRFIVAAIVVLGTIQLIGFTLEEIDRRNSLESQIAPTPLPCDQPYVQQDRRSGEVILSCEPPQTNTIRVYR